MASMAMPRPGSNQFFPTMPSLPNMTPRGTGSSAPGSGSTGTGIVKPTTGNAMPFDLSQFNWSGGTSGDAPQMWGVYSNKGSGVATEPLQFPNIASGLSSYLQSQIGQGVPANPLLMALMQFLGGGQTSIPGANTLAGIANNGISALPEWQAMLDAMQRNIGENQANLKEQFALGGNLAGSPFGTAMTDFMTQTTKDQNSLLGQLTQQNILQGQLPAAESLMGLTSGMSQFGQTLLPQYNPLLQLMGQLGTSYAPMYGLKKGGGVLGGLLGNMGTLFGMGSSIAEGAAGGGGLTDILSSLAGMFLA